jgi:hypothetical protein
MPFIINYSTTTSIPSTQGYILPTARYPPQTLYSTTTTATSRSASQRTYYLASTTFPIDKVYNTPTPSNCE